MTGPLESTGSVSATWDPEAIVDKDLRARIQGLSSLRTSYGAEFYDRRRPATTSAGAAAGASAPALGGSWSTGALELGPTSSSWTLGSPPRSLSGASGGAASPDGPLSPTSPGGAQPWTTTYSTLCSETLGSERRAPQRFGKVSRKNLSTVPMGSVDGGSSVPLAPQAEPTDFEAIKASLPLRGSSYSSLRIDVYPPQERRSTAHHSFKMDFHRPAKTLAQETFHGHLNSKSEVFRSRLPVKGEQAWHQCQDDVAFRSSVHKWPRHRDDSGPHFQGLERDVHAYRSTLAPMF